MKGIILLSVRWIMILKQKAKVVFKKESRVDAKVDSIKI